MMISRISGLFVGAGLVVIGGLAIFGAPQLSAQDAGDAQETGAVQDTADDDAVQRRRDRRLLPRRATRRPQSILPGPFIPPGSLGPTAFPEGTVPAAGEVFAGNELQDPEEGSGEDSGDPSIFELDAEGNDEGKDELGFESVETGLLSAPDPAASGILTPESGGYRADFWRGTSRSLIEDLIVRMPVTTRSPAANRMAKKLLLSAVALPPITRVDRDWAGPAYLLERRMQKLADTGDFDALADMLDLVPPEYESAAIRDIRAETYLLAGDLLGACDVARQGRADEGAAKWMRMTALCQALDGEQGALGLTLGLLEETGGASPQFMILIETALSRTLNAGTVTASSEVLDNGTSETNPVDTLPDQPFEAFDAALYQAAGLPIPEGVLDSASPALLGALARRPELDLEFRVEAAEIAAGRGIVSPRRLASAFEAMEFTSGERASSLLLADTDLGARVDALLFQMAQSAETPVEQLEFIKTAWQRAKRENLMPALAGVLVRTLRRLPRDETLVAYADDVGRIALFAGDTRLANDWYDMARRNAAVGDIEATRALVSLWPLIFVSDSAGKVPFSEDILNLWRQSQMSLTDDERFGRSALFYGVLEALGYQVSEELWREALAGPVQESRASPSLSVWRQLIVAGRQGRQGEAVLLALIAVGDAGPAGADPSALSAVIHALKEVGLDAEAREFAIEALIANGL